MGEWTKKTTSSNKRRALILSFLLLCVVNSSESSVATSDNDDIKIDAVAVEVDTDDANNKNIEQENPSSTNNNPSHEDIAELEEIILNTNNNNDENINKQRTLQYTPPTHFQITAHVQTNLHTGHSYFLPKESLPTSFAHLPFLECGAIGSTTEGLPLVSGVFRHVPHTAVVPKRDDMDVEWENLEGVMVEDVVHGANGEAGDLGGSDMLNVDDSESYGAGENSEGDHPKRPSPPKYVVALSSMEITVGGNGNETQKFDAGDVIFIEDTWWGVWDDDLDNDDDDKLNENGDIVESTEETSTEQQDDDVADGDIKMKGYIMRASSESQTDLNVIMLTVPNAIHRHWKNAQHAMAMANRETQEAQRKQQSVPSQPTSNKMTNEFGTRRPWWKGPTTFLHKHNSKQQQQQQQQSQPSSTLPTPCSLEPDPAFAHPSTSSTTLSQHFTQHFTGILRRSSNPHPSFLPHHHQDLLLPILAQTVAAAVGCAMALALVLQLWQIIPGPIALGFGSACVLGFGTWGFVWLGEEILGQWELWRERRRLERMMSEGWGRGGGGGGSASMMMGDVSSSAE
mmetsp:Transcript_20971/g.37882  ORF Transcript_20971/g.37882 Transcript_20971/m.37882 type:complete len:569 (-) Transcript_20971:45-1751(-)